MSSEHDDGTVGASAGRMSGGAQQGSAAIERRLEALAAEMAGAIESSPEREREALHDYAVSLLRDRAPTTRVGGEGGLPGEASEGGGRRTSGTNAASLIGYGFLLLPVGIVLLVVFPPVGMSLLVAGLASIVLGVGVALVTKVLPQASAS